MNPYKKIICLIALILVAGCGKEKLCNCLKKTEDEITEIRNTGTFTQIEMHDKVDVIIHPDSIYSLSVTCGKNLLDGIKTEVDNDRLIIHNINKCNWLRDLDNHFTVRIGTPSLTYISNSGTGNLYFADTLYTDEFLIESFNGTGEMNILINCPETFFKLHTGPGDIKVAGSTGICYVYSAGNGFFDGSRLESGYAYVDTKSTGDCTVNVNKELGVSIAYNGDVYYMGNPYKVESQISGSGHLYKK